jgi:hypothetical protein
MVNSIAYIIEIRSNSGRYLQTGANSFGGIKNILHTRQFDANASVVIRSGDNSKIFSGSLEQARDWVDNAI